MIRDVDYVTMEDYRRDTREISEGAASLIEGQAKEIRQLKVMISQLIYSAGEIRVYDKLDYDEIINFKVDYDIAKMEKIYTTLRKK